MIHEASSELQARHSKKIRKVKGEKIMFRKILLLGTLSLFSLSFAIFNPTNYTNGLTTSRIDESVSGEGVVIEQVTINAGVITGIGAVTATTVNVTELNVAGISTLTGVLKVNAINEVTSAQGVDVDGVLLKDNTILVGSAGTAIGTISEGVYTPTISALTNVAASTMHQCTWYRVGNRVTVFGRIDIDPTSDTSATFFEMDIPVVSNFTQGWDAGGAGVYNANLRNAVAIFAVASNDTFQFAFLSDGTSEAGLPFSVSYLIQ
jgi:hypothetical protein